MSVQPSGKSGLAPAEGFRAAMRRLAGTVTIVTTRHEARRYGMAATAVCSVCAEPPTLLVCVNRSASIHEPIAAAGRFCVNLLSLEHAELVAPFSGRLAGEARFDHGHWVSGALELPCLQDAQASVFCVVRQAVPYATHTVFFGEAVAVRVRQDVAPLVYQDGRLAASRELAPAGRLDKP